MGYMDRKKVDTQVKNLQHYLDSVERDLQAIGVDAYKTHKHLRIKYVNEVEKRLLEIKGDLHSNLQELNQLHQEMQEHFNIIDQTT